MNKSQGTLIGTVLMSALLLRGGGTGLFSGGDARRESAAVRTPAERAQSGQGPWVASCEYWAPARLTVADAPAGKDQQAEAADSCAGAANRWGIPQNSGPHAGLRITTIIATVPDPVHTNFALQFDRAIDALIDAGEDNGYLSSYYWLPWQKDARGSSEAGSAAEGVPSGEKTQEHEPGLIIFRHTFSDSDDDINNGFHAPLYVFLVAETPTSGIDGRQMQKAIEYQKDLAGTGAKVVRSLKSADQMAIIGPIFSGSATSFREVIDTELAAETGIASVQARGITSTQWAANQLNGLPQVFRPAAADRRNHSPAHRGKIEYNSFANDTVFDQSALAGLITNAGTAGNRIAVLIEDGTTLGQASLVDLKRKNLEPLFIRYPREISILRNAQTEQQSKNHSAEQDSNAPPSPYLHLSLKDSNGYDSVPHLSREVTPLSQEAQLMTIARQLELCRAQYVVISGTDVLDQLFLAQFLHRAVPDARLVFDGGDLLFEREIDDVPFIGSLTVGPYPLARLSHPTGPAYGGRAFSDWATEAYYNAASFTLSDSASAVRLADYRNPFGSSGPRANPSLWITAIGSDGYYPLGIAGPATSKGSAILPEIPAQDRGQRQSADTPAWKPDPAAMPFHPARAWHFLCFVVFLLCMAHAVLIHIADLWSPFTRDLAVDQNDQPYRRSMSIHIGAAMLFSMSVVTGWPLFASLPLLQPALLDWAAAAGALAAGLLAVVATLRKTWRYKYMPKSVTSPTDTRFYNKFNLLALVTAVAVPTLWILICSPELALPGSHAGLFFAFRCLHPGSGVSPLVPIFLLLLSWYLWSVFQTLRLRFSESNRPHLPGRTAGSTPYPLYVADEDLAACEDHRSSCLYRNISCLLITREAVRRFLRAGLLRPAASGTASAPEKSRRDQDRFDWTMDAGLTTIYFGAFVVAVSLPFAQGMDRLLWTPHHLPAPYEFLIKALFFPLLIIALTGWLRMIFVWGSLQRGLLQRLENLPIRFAFDRLKGAGWMAMFRQSGLREQWRDMARSTESMRQFRNQPGLSADLSEALEVPARQLEGQVTALLHHIGGNQPPQDAIVSTAVADLCVHTDDLPCQLRRADLGLMHALEASYGKFATVLLDRVLVPYWSTRRTGLVESALVESQEASVEKHKTEAAAEQAAPEQADPVQAAPEAPAIIRAAEEFVAIRYVSLIRAVLVNLRYLMMFISAAFVLAIVAWNSYPFEPHQLVNWLFTILLFALGLGVVWVFAQMHRDPILSRITHTTPNELGVDFYLRIASFGAVPVLTWFAYSFPQLGGTIFRLLRPGVDVIR